MTFDPTELEEIYQKDLPLSDEDLDKVISALRQSRKETFDKPPRRRKKESPLEKLGLTTDGVLNL